MADFYNDFVAVAGVEGVSKDAVKQAGEKESECAAEGDNGDCGDFCSFDSGDYCRRVDSGVQKLYRQSVFV